MSVKVKKQKPLAKGEKEENSQMNNL